MPSYTPPAAADLEHTREAVVDILNTKLLFDVVSLDPITKHPFPITYNQQGQPIEFISDGTLNQFFRRKYQKDIPYCDDDDFVENPLTKQRLTKKSIIKTRTRFQEFRKEYDTSINAVSERSQRGYEQHNTIITIASKSNFTPEMIRELKQELVQILSSPNNPFEHLSYLVMSEIFIEYVDTHLALEFYLTSCSAYFGSNYLNFCKDLITANPKMLSFVHDMIKGQAQLATSAEQSILEWKWYRETTTELLKHPEHQSSDIFREYSEKSMTEAQIIDTVDQTCLSNVVDHICSSASAYTLRPNTLNEYIIAIAKKPNVLSKLKSLKVLSKPNHPVIQKLTRRIEQLSVPFDYWMAVICSNPALLSLVPTSVQKIELHCTGRTNTVTRVQGYHHIAFKAICAKPSEISLNVLYHMARSYFGM